MENNQPTGICPIGSEPHLAADYVPRGKEEKLDDLPIYTIGSGEKAVIQIYDIYGFNAGRTRLMADQISDAGYLVVLPDFFRGDGRLNHPDGGLEWVKQYSWQKCIEDLNNKVYPYLESKGVKQIGILGYCWGSHILFRAAANGDKVKAGVNFHPSLMKKEDPPEKIAEGVNCPVMMLSAGNDPAEVREGGIVEKVLKEKPFGDKVVFRDFPDMAHGWVPRSDLSVANNARDVKLAMEMCLHYFKQHL